MNTPIRYIEGFVSDPNKAMELLWNEAPWERREQTPRLETFFANEPVEYTYGAGRGVRTYRSTEWHPLALELRDRLNNELGARFDLCFGNAYENQKDQLGWHADDSPEIDQTEPIAIISLGVAREIWFCPIGEKDKVEKLLLAPGSLCLMMPGMQLTHWHRIPKAGFECGRRISLTYRALKKD